MAKYNTEKLNNLPPMKILAKHFLKEPLFMFFCSEPEKRQSFLEKYFNYSLAKWNSGNELIISDKGKTIASLVNPDNFKYKFTGKNCLPLRRSKYSFNIFLHQEIVQDIINIVVPENLEKRLLTIYTSSLTSTEDILEIIDICKEKSEKEGFVLVYETLSKRHIAAFEEKGFETGYARQFMNTQFFQTVMTYNV